MNQRTLTHGTVRGAMCNVCGLICQRLTGDSHTMYGVAARNSYGGLQAHRKIVHGRAIKRDRPA